MLLRSSMRSNAASPAVRRLIVGMHLIAQNFGLKLITANHLKHWQRAMLELLSGGTKPWLKASRIKSRRAFNPRTLAADCRKTLREMADPIAQASRRIRQKLERLVVQLGLEDVEVSVLLLALAIRTDEILSNLCEEI